MFDKPLETMTDKELLKEQQEFTQKIAEGGLFQHEINLKFASILTETLNRLAKKEIHHPHLRSLMTRQEKEYSGL